MVNGKLSGDWKTRFEEQTKLLNEKAAEYDRLQDQYFRLAHDSSMKNIDDKFEPLYLQKDIDDQDFSAADYPFLGRSPHRRKDGSAKRTIPAQRLSETGYHSEFSESTGGTMGDSSRGRARKQSETLKPKVERLKILKEKAGGLCVQIENQRGELHKNIRDHSNSRLNSADDELSLVDKEIAAQKQMLKEADETLNQILTKMEHEVYELDPDFREDSSEVQELTTFLTEQNNKVKERLGNLEDENQNLMNENIELEKQLKNYKNQATSEINKVKRANQKLRAKSDQQNKMDLQATNTLSEEQMRLALEEKMREMWQPEEVLNRIATFVDSNFQDIGNDEFSSALGNIKARSEELKQLSIKKATDVVKNKIKKPTDNSKEVEAQLKHEFNQRGLEMRQLLNKQKRAESDNSNLQKKLKDLKNDLNNTNSTLAEKDGVNLNMEKEINRLKANLKLSTNENDQCQKRLDQALADYNNLRSSNLMENQQMQKYKRDLTDLERKLAENDNTMAALNTDLLAAIENANEKSIKNETLENNYKLLESGFRRQKHKNAQLADELQHHKNKHSDLRQALKDQEIEARRIEELVGLVGELRKDLENQKNLHHQTKHFDDRFDEVLDALVKMEKRLHSGAKNRTERILKSIADLNDLLDTLDIPEKFKFLKDMLKDYRNFMIAKTDPNDEFYFVPSGYKAPEVTVKSTGMETGTENLYVNNPRKKKIKKVREGLYGYVPVHHYVEQGPRYQTIKIKKKKVYEDYDLVITSKPEELAVKHSKQLLKSLSITY